MTILRTKRKPRRAPTEAGAADLPEFAPPSLRDRVLGTAILLAAAALFVWLSFLLCRPLVRMASSPEKMESFIRSQGALGWIAFLGIEILQGFLPIPLEITAAAGGYVFGRVQGAALTLCATVISTTAIFYLARAFGFRLLRLFFSPARAKKLTAPHSAGVRAALTVTVFLIPGTPKRMFIFSAGMVPQRFSTFLLLSTLARAPALLACSFGGHALGQGDYGQAAVIFIITGTLGLLGAGAWHFASERKGGGRSK